MDVKIGQVFVQVWRIEIENNAEKGRPLRASVSAKGLCT